MRDLRLVGRRRAVAAVLASVLATPQPMQAWCGEQFPSWAFYLKWDQNPAVPFTYQGAQGSAFYRIVGDITREQKTGVPPVLVVGAPGVSYEYLENFEALTVSDRRVIEVTFAGTASSGSAFNPALATPDACAEQLRAVCRALKVPAVHVVAHGLGALPALSLASAASDVRLKSLTLVSPYGSVADLRPDALGDLGSAKSVGEVAGRLLPTVSSNARSSCIAEAREASAGPLLLPMLLGSSGLEIRLRGAALGTRLAACTAGLPILLATGGARDIVDTDGWGASLPTTVSRATFGASGHLPFVEERDAFLLRLLEFFDAADGTTTNREFKFGDAIQTIKEISGR